MGLFVDYASINLGKKKNLWIQMDYRAKYEKQNNKALKIFF